MKDFKENDLTVPTLRGEVDAFFRKTLDRKGAGSAFGIWNPQLDVTEEDDRIILEVDLPGVRREDIKIEVSGHNLIITGSRKIVRRTVGQRFSHCERVSGSFRRVIPLPRRIDEAGIGASLEEGILRVELPKRGAV